MQKVRHTMSEIANFFLKRRSVMARKMSSKPINDDHISLILQAGIRVPDHGGLSPWKLVVIKGDSLKDVDNNIILPEFIKANPKADKKFQEKESLRMQRAGVVIAVISKPIEHPSIPEWEMHLSSGAVCMNLLSCAQSIGYAAQWLTEWYAYNNKMLTYLGGDVNKDKISGFIYIGHKVEDPNERKRPDPNDVITFL